MSPNIGLITEQGDLGFGFDELNDKDREVYNESVNKDNSKDKEKK